MQPDKPKNAIRTLIFAWLTAGTLDILSALILVGARTGKNPAIVFRYIASAVFGKETAYSGGTLMIIAGLLFHYLIALIFSILFFVIYPRMFRLFRNKFVCAIVYGLFVWCVMNLAVVPLSRIHLFPASLERAIENMVILMVCIGLPLALIIHPYYFRKSQTGNF